MAYYLHRNFRGLENAKSNITERNVRNPFHSSHASIYDKLDELIAEREGTDTI